MKRTLRFALLCPLLAMVCFSSCKEKVVEQPYKGYPSRTGEIDIRKGFVNPPKGYGNVPFYWWMGDSLNMNRLNEQLDTLSTASTDGLCISYIHTHAEVEVELNAEGYGQCGRVERGIPGVLSDEWYAVWNEFSASCAKKGIGLGMDDYVIAPPGNKEYVDDVRALPEMANYQGRLHMSLLPKDSEQPEHVVSVVPKEGTDSVYCIFTTPSPELHPEYGNKIVEAYFHQFETHMDEEGLKGMNYFFQDELVYDLNLYSWCEDMPEQFKQRKGYDILPLLPSLFEEYGEQYIKTRLDYAEVATQLAEERYFGPIYHWNADKGLIYGSDNQSRGLDPTFYLDYFRAEKWFTAPGNDAPARGSSFMQTKVSSSVTHLYQRPRTWLEAFHSMGWDANGALLTYQLNHHLIAGGNLLCMHGLYYSTHGGWWEWAPPSFHFRMPYWPHMKVWLKYAERLCFLLSQGVHVADVAILYPTETMQAFPYTNPNATFGVAGELSPHGVDYDFIDYASLQSAEVADGMLNVSDEHYRVLVLADTKALHEETLAKIEEFAAGGGIVVALGDLMEPLQQNANITKVGSPQEVLSLVRKDVKCDFTPKSAEGRVLHRKVGKSDVYMVMDVPEGDELHFRSTGKLEVWDAQHGTMTEKPVLRTDEDGVWVRHDCAQPSARLYVFSPGKPKLEKADDKKEEQMETLPVEGEWDLTIVPTMNNKWGDFRLPATNSFIGVEARQMDCAFLPGNATPDLNTMQSLSFEPYYQGFAPYMSTCNFDSSKPIDKVISEVLAAGEEGLKTWKPYDFSWQYGVFDSPGSQGYHGLKAYVESRYLILDQGAHQLFTTQVFIPRYSAYNLIVEGEEPYKILCDGEPITVGERIYLQGWHRLIVAYKATPKADYTLEGMRCFSIDRRQRSMVVFLPNDAPEPQPHGKYEHIVASKWYDAPHLIYDINGEQQGAWVYRFQTAPGTTSMHFDVKGQVKGVWVDGKQVSKSFNSSSNVALKEPNSGVSEVYVLALPEQGYTGAAFFTQPVAMTCQGGKASVGDWTELGAMRFYSGGVKYAKDIEIKKGKGQTVRIDLGEVDATCDVRVNGKPVDVLINKPYILDITDFVKNGTNHIEVMVYSSLANHYQTIPSPYKGHPHAGLIGPVQIQLVK